MNSENEATLKLFAREIVAEMVRSNGAQMLPATTAGVLQACGTLAPTSGCENLLYAPITTHEQADVLDLVVVAEVADAGAQAVVAADAAASSAARRARWAGRATAAARRSFRGAAERESVNEWDPVAMRPKMECI